MTEEHDDVLIVGAGASGAAFAWRCAEAGLKVTCLEQGDWTDPASTASTRPDWELLRQTTETPYPNLRRHPADYPIDDTDTPIKPLLYNGVGGSTIKWGAHAPRLRPSDFRVRTLDGVADDWPIGHADLEPYYDLNDRIMGTSGLAGDPGNPPRSRRPMPPLPLGAGATRLAAAFDRLGWHWWPCDVAIASAAYDEGREACNHCGPCDLGCPRGARASTDLTYWPKALRAGARLVTWARVFEVTTGPDGRADGVAWYDRDGRVRRRRADVVVLAASGIGTPRLMLLSTSRRHPNGLANDTGLVGRRLMHHPTGMVTGVFDERLEGFKGAFAVSILCQHFYETDRSRGFPRGYQMQCVRSDGPLGTALGGYLPRIPWGRDHHRRFLDTFGHTVSLTVTTEDLPDPENRVELHPTLVDAWGIPAPKLTYRVAADTTAMLEHGIGSAETALAEAGAKRIEVLPLVTYAGFHLMGTARMGADPADSVVDADGRAHACDNLMVVDASVFVTAGALNPTSTIQAFALRAADRLIARRREQRAGSQAAQSGWSGQAA